MNLLQPKTHANRLSWCFGVVMTLLLAGCNSGDKDPILTPDTLTGLTQIVVNPANAAIPAGLNRQFQALGVYADGTSVNISDQVSWTSATPAVASVNTNGSVTALTNGTAVISAAVAGKTGQTTLTVTDAALVSITLNPLAASAMAGVNVQFGATGVYSNGTSQDLTRSVLWTSSDLTVASFNPNQLPDSGLASALMPGVSTVVATMGALSASTTFTVTASNLTGLVITPANPGIVVGLNQQMTVTGTFDNGNSVDLTSQAVWTSTNTSLLTFNANGAADSGLATAVAAGTVSVSASFAGMTATNNVVVNNAEITSLSITPETAAIAAGNNQQFIAMGVYNNGTTANITSIVTWASGDTDIAYVNANLASDSGLVTSLTPGSATISATIETSMGPISNNATLTVNNAVVTSVTVTPATPQLINGFTQQLQATAHYSDQTTVDVTTSAIWSSADTSVVTMNPSGLNNSGLATPVMAGNAVVTATWDANTAGSTVVTVVDAILNSITVTPLLPNIAAGTSQQFSASGTFSTGSTMDLTRYVDWQSADTTVASFNPNFQNDSGLLSALVMGNSDITASLQGVQSSTELAVSAATLVSVALTPMTPEMSSGQTFQMQLTGTYTDNSVVDLSSGTVWSSNNTSVASFNPNLQPNSGLISALAAGNTILNAEFTTDDLRILSGSTLLIVTGALAMNPQAPELGMVEGFVLAASQGITTTDGSSINDGDMAILDTDRTKFIGFTNGAAAGQFTQLNNGVSFAPDDANPPYMVPVPYATSAAYIDQLKTDLMTVATALAADTNPSASVTMLNDDQLGGLTLNRGVYHLSGDGLVSQGDLSLDAQGDADSVFIINIAGNLSTEVPGGNIVLLNSTKASNVYWRIGGYVILASDSQFAGNLVATHNILLQTGATVQGRLLSVTGTVLLDANSITKSL